MSEIPRTVTKEWKWRRREVIIRDEYECQKCGAEGGPEGDQELHVHHIVPVNADGGDDHDNLETLCAPCHRELHSKTPGEGADFTARDVLKVFDESADAVLTTADLAAELAVGERAVVHELSQMCDGGVVGQIDSGPETTGWYAKFVPRIW